MTKFFTPYLYILLLMLQSTATLADDFIFSYVDFNFTSSTIDLGGTPDKIEGNGFGFALSIDFNPNYALTLSVQATTFDNFQQAPVETIQKTNLGITAHTQVAEHTAIYGNASALAAKTTVNENSTESGQSGIGYELKAGIRQMLSKNIELEFDATHFYVLEYPANSVKATLRYSFYKQISIGFAYKTGSNQDTISINARTSF